MGEEEVKEEESQSGLSDWSRKSFPVKDHYTIVADQRSVMMSYISISSSLI